MNIYDKNHPHNAVFCEQLRSVIDGNPRATQVDIGGIWSDLKMLNNGLVDASWSTCRSYRIKPLAPVMITRTVTYPAPIAVALAIGTEYFALEGSLVASYTWAGDSIDLVALMQRRAFTNEADAQACRDALFGGCKNERPVTTSSSKRTGIGCAD